MTESFLESMIATKQDEYLAEVKIKYGLELVKNEFFKFLLFTIFFIIIGKFSIYLFVLATFIPIRVFSGGIHMKTNITCSIFSFAFLLLGICILPQVIVSLKISFVMLSISLTIISLCSPFSSPKKPITSKRRYYKYKLISIFFTCIGIGIILFCFYSNHFVYAYPAQWVIVLQAIQLLIAHIIKRKEIKTI